MKRTDDLYHLYLGDLRSVDAVVRADIEGAAITIVSVTIPWVNSDGTLLLELDALSMLSVCMRGQIKDYLRDKYCSFPVWPDVPEGMGA